MDEFKFLEYKNAQIYKTKHIHGECIWTLVDLVKAEDVEISETIFILKISPHNIRTGIF